MKDSARLNEIINKGGRRSAVHGPEQREILARIQAFMSLVEGYSNFVMDGVGKEILPTYQEMKETFARRRDPRPGPSASSRRCWASTSSCSSTRSASCSAAKWPRRRGWKFLNQAWKNEENLPTYDEIHHPFVWIERMRETEGRRVEHFRIRAGSLRAQPGPPSGPGELARPAFIPPPGEGIIQGKPDPAT